MTDERFVGDRTYPDSYAYLRGEYPESIEDALDIINRHIKLVRMPVPGPFDDVSKLALILKDADQLALEIAGYFCGVLTVDGEPRGYRDRERRAE